MSIFLLLAPMSLLVALIGLAGFWWTVKADQYDERQKAALAYTEAIAWRLDVDDKFWDRLHSHFSEPELVELGCFVALTFGQQSWIRLLDIDHHEYMAGTDASMAPGFESAEALAESEAKPDYWAKA